MNYLLILVAFFTLTACAQDVDVSWRFPVDSDLTGDWASQADAPFHVEADFDGNGDNDDMWLVIEKSGEGWQLIAFLNGSHQAIPLTSSESGRAQWFGLRKLDPGTLKTACGKGYWECAEDEPAMLDLPNSAVAFFKFESASTVYYWNHAENAFKSVAESD